MSETAIEVSGLTKDYGGGRGVFGLSFTVQPGEAFGILGPNGAGKTTTIRQLMGFVRPGAGSARIFGQDCFAGAARVQSQVGYLPGDAPAPPPEEGWHMQPDNCGGRVLIRRHERRRAV